MPVSLLPLRRPGQAILFTHDVGAPLLETRGALGHVLDVVQTFLDPHVHDRDRERGVRSRADRYPASTEQLRGGVAMRIDVNEFDAELLCPQAPLGSLEAHVAAVGALRVARPEHDLFGVLQAVLDGAVVAGPSHPLAVSPVMQRAPVPAFPAVRVRRHAREADQVAEAHQ
jgi:hypothetical protein